MWRAQLISVVLTLLAMLFLKAADGRPVYSAMWGEQVRLQAPLNLSGESVGLWNSVCDHA